jgi:hypothetical protein
MATSRVAFADPSALSADRLIVVAPAMLVFCQLLKSSNPPSTKTLSNAIVNGASMV